MMRLGFTCIQGKKKWEHLDYKIRMNSRYCMNIKQQPQPYRPNAKRDMSGFGLHSNFPIAQGSGVTASRCQLLVLAPSTHYLHDFGKSVNLSGNSLILKFKRSRKESLN